MGRADHPAALVSHRIRCTFDAIVWNYRATKWTSVPCFIGMPKAQISGAANCTLQLLLDASKKGPAVEPASLGGEQNRAMVQETEKPGVAVAEVCRRHGNASGLLFCCRVQLGLTARKRRKSRG
jgi:hypothetical protein